MTKVNLAERIVKSLFGFFVLLMLASSFLKDNILYQSFVEKFVMPLGKLPFSSQSWCTEYNFPIWGILISLIFMIISSLIKHFLTLNPNKDIYALIMYTIGVLILISSLLRCVPLIM